MSVGEKDRSGKVTFTGSREYMKRIGMLSLLIRDDDINGAV